MKTFFEASAVVVIASIIYLVFAGLTAFISLWAINTAMGLFDLNIYIEHSFKSYAAFIILLSVVRALFGGK